MSTNRQIEERGQRLAEAAREARREAAAGLGSGAGATPPTAGGYGGERLAQETTGKQAGCSGRASKAAQAGLSAWAAAPL